MFQSVKQKRELFCYLNLFFQGEGYLYLSKHVEDCVRCECTFNWNVESWVVGNVLYWFIIFVELEMESFIDFFLLWNFIEHLENWKVFFICIGLEMIFNRGELRIWMHTGVVYIAKFVRQPLILVLKYLVVEFFEQISLLFYWIVQNIKKWSALLLGLTLANLVQNLEQLIFTRLFIGNS